MVFTCYIGDSSPDLGSGGPGTHYRTRKQLVDGQRRAVVSRAHGFYVWLAEVRPWLGKPRLAAAEAAGIFLLWAHPVDFATDPHGMLAGFRAICAQAAKLRAGGRLEVITLGQLAGE